MESIHPPHLLDFAQRLKNEGYDLIHIKSELRKSGANEDAIKKIVEELLVPGDSKRMRNGLTCIGIGALLLLSSFLLTITSGITHFSTDIVLYGLTTAGISVLLTGMYLLFN
ncbi:MAG: hypothetical protein ACK4Y6_00270 [Bacteroidota bacterium]|jgi:hypothetical protein